MDCQMLLETFRFCSKVSSKCRRCHFRGQISNISWCCILPDPLEICRHFGLTFLGRQISVGLPSWTEASKPLVNRFTAFKIYCFNNKSLAVLKYFNFMRYSMKKTQPLPSYYEKNLKMVTLFDARTFGTSFMLVIYSFSPLFMLRLFGNKE